VSRKNISDASATPLGIKREWYVYVCMYGIPLVFLQIMRERCNNPTFFQYTGTWYQTERYPYPEIAANSICIGARYTLNEATKEIKIVNWENVGGEVNSIEGIATWTEGTAMITVVLQTNPDDPNGKNKHNIIINFSSLAY
jgi:lipocalin